MRTEMHYRVAPRVGFTLIELLITVTIIGVLVGLVIPAVQSSRESARRVQCAQHMKQIGLALQNYLTHNGVFPAVNLPSGTAVSGRKWSYYSGHAFSPLARSLSELEQQVLWNATNFGPIPTQGLGLQSNLTVMTTSIAIFLCPSDRACPVPGYARVSFRFNAGPGAWYAPSDVKPGSWDGPFTVHRTYGPADFTDGLSQTVGVSERLQGSWVAGGRTPGDYILLGLDAHPPERALDQVIAACSQAPAGIDRETRGGESWFISGFHFTGYSHALTPNPSNTDCSVYGFHEDFHNRTLHEGLFPARSGHPGGVHAMLMDGSVRFVRNAVDTRVWWALATRSGGDLVSADSY